ncbi:MAG: DegT/DnrJ/EryC1/StrS family aminotransferase [Nitrospiraceae bacterium]|nr:DegT/DnrJ/EryC1/StrS family aminotransferase [Nitrospiraceae bacterium]
MRKRVPFLDLSSIHRDLEDELVAAFRETMRTCRFIGGPMVEDFEKNFAGFCDTKHCIGVGSGTDALRFSLMASGVNPGDTVITVPNTFIATTEAISQAGAIVDFVDIDEQTYNMDPAKLAAYFETKCHIDNPTGRAVSARTGSQVAAVLPVHIYGQMADMDSIMDIADKYNAIVIEDACQAHGAEYFSAKTTRWRRAGSVGISAAFSFYPGKNLGACGEAGAVTTDNEEIARKIRMLRDHGQMKKYHHEMEGYNGRLDSVQAGILNIKLRRLSGWNEKRRRHAAYYRGLSGQTDGLVLPYEPPWSKAVYHLYIVRAPDRNGLQEYLARHGIETGLHYPLPLHLQKAYSAMGYKAGDFNVAEKASAQVLSLLMYPAITSEQQDYVIGTVKEFLSERRSVA